ncbi:sigma-70 family RNA polymerase sigma factor [Bacillus tequilensis]|uniref:Sigma-70 family RNA polymerase sigma factor n=1 Tax=Bacillus tequilensis TaxID=227866 RepID=A0A6H0WJH5_9BACI|nr:sigma-70 family RNA polymerase sigma factor [Bacillus tequilensis]QIW79687.1 sigma-70 family RNA polymerase sigma factor [Bacillus tequilensis]
MKHRDSIEDLYRQYYQEILNYLYRRTRHLETAKDLAQDTFVKALNGLASFRGHSSIRTWLYTIAHHTFVNWYRRNAKYKFSDISKSDGLTQTTYEQPEEYLSRTVKSETIRHEILQLKDQYQSVLILREFQELSYEEIAEILGWSLSKVKTTLHRARLELKKNVMKRREEERI